MRARYGQTMCDHARHVCVSVRRVLRVHVGRWACSHMIYVRAMGNVPEHQERCTCARGMERVDAAQGMSAHERRYAWARATIC